ncbi:vWA domain-containing protein [Marinigracilibium pacificum]|uniref:VWA domain-containing protein n=1 Tax=Marinigracilibium pacificum TaxID=2729599 RepID=A0A848IY96_9BACT|nr:VWA domain-containing protein [Marinigracilibium pacificum]NMM48606.1 VWA domain-containing protein [Marinigracilibium pacificum]
MQESDNLSNIPWYSLDWFNPDKFPLIGTGEYFDWKNEWVFYLLLLIPIILAVIPFLRKKIQTLEVALPKKDVGTDFTSYLRFIPTILLSLSFICMVIALARPQKTNEKIEQWSEGIDIMLLLDISESMKIQDLKPNRLEAAKKTALDFIDGRNQDRIGVVIFAGEAFTLAPMTTDYDLLRSEIEDITFSKIRKSGTAIGLALGMGINRMKESEAKSKVFILLSDGDNTAGNIDPKTAAEFAAGYGIKMYSIAIGREGRVRYGTDNFGQPYYVENSIDETTLRMIAEIGNGKFFRVENNKGLQEVFNTIDQLEKAKIYENRYKNTFDYYFVYLYWALALFLGWLLTKLTIFSNILVD